MKSVIKKSIYFIMNCINTGYYLLIPKQKKLVVDGFFNRILGYTKKNNLGDDLNFYVLEAISGKKVFSAPNLLLKSTNILFIGSILQKYMNSGSIIWGAGTIEEHIHPESRPYLVKAVRGPLTRQWLIKNNIDCPNIYSDPALLLPLIYRPKRKKKYKYGIIPHYRDWNSTEVKYLRELLGDIPINVISMSDYRTCEEVINKINECEYIISSSLHGIIIADAYKIPNIWVEFSNKVKGNGFKFRDYFLSVNRIEDRPLVITENLEFPEIESAFSCFHKPMINIMPFLQAAPIALPLDLLQQAKTYYNHEIS